MADPQPVPINAKFDDDFVTQLVVVLDTDTMREVAAKVAAGALNHFYTHALPCSCVSDDAGVSWPDRAFFLYYEVNCVRRNRRSCAASGNRTHASRDPVQQ
jgi:toluene-4-monooxygenase system protein B